MEVLTHKRADDNEHVRDDERVVVAEDPGDDFAGGFGDIEWVGHVVMLPNFF